MNKRDFCLLIVLAWTSSCSTGTTVPADPAPVAQPDRHDASFSAHGLTVERPADWQFISPVPDATVVPDTFVVMQGPAGHHTLAPAVEISHRTLQAADRRRNPEHVLQALVSEMVQILEGFETTAGPEPATVGGQPGARIFMFFTEGLPEGGSIERSARFYGVVNDEDVFIIRCIGPKDGSADGVFDAIVSSISIAG